MPDQTEASEAGCPSTNTLGGLAECVGTGGWWDVICAALPPLTDSEITTAATMLPRISAGIFDDVPEQGSSENGTAELVDQRPAQVSW